MPGAQVQSQTQSRKRILHPVRVLYQGVKWLDGDMIYLDPTGQWIFVSEDGVDAYAYATLRELIADRWGIEDNDDYVVAGWSIDPYRFDDYYIEARRYYEERYGR
jgi:hypothetical protein